MLSSGLLAEEEVLFAELPVVASVSRLPQRMADLPTSVTVLDREMIKAAGARDINDLLRLVPGFQTFAHTTDPTRVTYHGITDEDFSPRLQVLVDGRSLYSPLFRSGVNWNLIPVAIEDIERIEVVRGTNSASYGTNAFLGVINIVTLDPSLLRGATISTSQGNQGVRDYTVRLGTNLGESGTLRLTYQRKSDDALDDRADWSDSFRSRLIDIRSDLQLGNFDALQVRLGKIESRTRMGLTSGDNQAGYPLHPFEQSSTYFQTNLNHVLSDHADLSIRYAYTRDKAFDSFEAFSNDFNVYYRDASYTGDSTRHDVEIQHTTTPLPGIRLAWGGGYRHDEVRSEAMFRGNKVHTRAVTRGFGNIEWKPADWLTANGGLSLDHDSLSGTSTSPRVALNLHLTPENTIRLAAAKAVRSGAISDYKGEKWYEAHRDALGNPIPPGALYKYGYYANPNTPSERLNSFEIGYLGDWKRLGMSLDVRLFREVIPNRLLTTERSVASLGLCDTICQIFGGSSTADFVTPAQHVRIDGLEYQWQWRPLPGTRLVLNQAYIRIKARFLDSYLNDPNITSYYLSASALERDRLLAEDSAPRLASSLLWIQKLPSNFEFSLAGFHQGDMKWTRNSTADAYTRLDARLGYRFAIGKTRGEVAVTSQSLNGSHGEFRASGLDTDRIVTRRTWLTLGLEI